MNSQLLLCVHRETVELLVRKKAWRIVRSGSALLQVGMSSVPYSNLQNVIVHILPVTVPESTCKHSGLWFRSFQRWKSEPQKNLANFQPILWQILHKNANWAWIFIAEFCKWDLRDSSVDKGSRHQMWPFEFDPRTHTDEGEHQLPQVVLWLYIHAVAHVYTLIKIIKIE